MGHHGTDQDRKQAQGISTVAGRTRPLSSRSSGHSEGTLYYLLICVKRISQLLMSFFLFVFTFLFSCFGCRKALKEISVGELNPNETFQANVEAQLLSKLNHPAIVKFHASFVEQNNFCIITEYCEVRLFSLRNICKNLLHGNNFI